MGCTLSTDDILTVQNKELTEYLSKKDIQLVQQSWDLVQDDIEHVGLIMFQGLFTKERQLKKLFTQLMTKENSGEVVFDETKLRSHGRTVMDTLGAAVENLDDSTDLTMVLVQIGERHAHYGVRPDMIPPCRPIKPIGFYASRTIQHATLFLHMRRTSNIGLASIKLSSGFTQFMIPKLLRPAIIVALEEKLGPYFNAEVGQAWERVFNYIGSKLMKGISRWSEKDSMT